MIRECYPALSSYTAVLSQRHRAMYRSRFNQLHRGLKKLGATKICNISTDSCAYLISGIMGVEEI